MIQSKKNRKPFIASTLTLMSLGAITLASGQVAENPIVDESIGSVFSFSTVGDSRQDPAAPDSTMMPLHGQDSIWLQNTKAWFRIEKSIAEQRSKMLFFNGDMIMGYGNAIAPTTTTIAGILGSDLMAFYKQYAFWRGLVAPLLETGTYVIPVPGNHETQWKAGGKKAQVANENAWRDNMGDLISNNPKLGAIMGSGLGAPHIGDERNPADSLSSDQSKLTYSFDYRGSHFAVINTDPVGKDSHAPTQWLQADLTAAQARGAKHFFVFGHKPAYTYFYGSVIPPLPALPLPGKPAGLDVDIPARNAFWDVIESFHATYFCGHEHIFNTMQPRGGAWQIMVGSGGSPFEANPGAATINANDRKYAWATVKVDSLDNVQLKAFGFDDHFGATTLLQTIALP